MIKSRVTASRHAEGDATRERLLRHFGLCIVATGAFYEFASLVCLMSSDVRSWAQRVRIPVGYAVHRKRSRVKGDAGAQKFRNAPLARTCEQRLIFTRRLHFS